MSTSGRSGTDGSAPDASDVAATLRDAAFVRLLARADGDCLAAAGLLARALAERGVPYQIRVGRFGETLAEPESDENADGQSSSSPATNSQDDAQTDDTTVGVGLDPAADTYLSGESTPTSATAFDAAQGLDASPNPVLALAGVLVSGANEVVRDGEAVSSHRKRGSFSSGSSDESDGVVAAEHPPGAGETDHILEAVRASGVERRPGVGVPTDDLADGIAHTTLAHADYSGDAGAAQATLAELGLPAELGESAHKRVASEFALAVAGAGSATDRAAETVERALRPHALPDGPFATVEGYADVLEAVARERPGTGVALALGHGAHADALEAWRDHAQQAHTALREATTGRYDGLFVARTDSAPVETVAGLLRDFRSPEPVALVVSDAEAAAAATEKRSVGATMTEAARAVGGVGDGTARRGYARFDPEADAGAKEFLAAFREARR